MQKHLLNSFESLYKLQCLHSQIQFWAACTCKVGLGVWTGRRLKRKKHTLLSWLWFETCAFGQNTIQMGCAVHTLQRCWEEGKGVRSSHLWLYNPQVISFFSKSVNLPGILSISWKAAHYWLLVSVDNLPTYIHPPACHLCLHIEL